MGIKIAVTGEIRSGKDTVTELIMKDDLCWQILYYAEGIRNIIDDYFPEALIGNDKPRRHYQEIGQSMRKINPDVWVNQVDKKFNRLQREGYKNFIITDLRQPNEYEWAWNNGFIFIKVESDENIRIQRMKDAGDAFNIEDLQHETELHIKNLPYDYLITNNGTLQELQDVTANVWAKIKKGDALHGKRGR